MTDRRSGRARRAVGAVLLLVAGAAGEAVGQGGAEPVWRASAEYGHVRFDRVFSDWNLASASLAARLPRVTAIGRVHYADRFDRSSWQVEGDVYPRFGRSGYAYLSAAHSPGDDTTFPEWRFGAEAWANLPGAWEVSAGVRELRFREVDVTIWTGSVGRYHGNGWTSLRPYVADDGDGTSATVVLTTRRYLPDADNWVGAMVGYGSTPIATVTEAELARGDVFRLGVEGTHDLRGRLGWSWSAGYEREELGDGGTRSRVAGGAGIRIDF